MSYDVWTLLTVVIRTCSLRVYLVFFFISILTSTFIILICISLYRRQEQHVKIHKYSVAAIKTRTGWMFQNFTFESFWSPFLVLFIISSILWNTRKENSVIGSARWGTLGVFCHIRNKWSNFSVSSSDAVQPVEEGASYFNGHDLIL